MISFDLFALLCRWLHTHVSFPFVRFHRQLVRNRWDEGEYDQHDNDCLHNSEQEEVSEELQMLIAMMGNEHKAYWNGEFQ